ncbi:MFS transporter [Hypericibacter adhaerens]|uniref:MFS transporter n=1 Tax=Hypericibacter adhaerens TaxID=2602016 RepID=A0A5J6MYJ2_9PROT|nr:MFS transporter [Hypericibacter adhaerens]QEX21350.1 MFS transporter [Hypericibacter adhaerens]
MTAIALTERQRRRSLAAIISAGFGAGMSMASLLPLLSLLMERHGYDAGLIGLNAAMFPVSVLLFGSLAPLVVRRLGALRTLWLSAIGFTLVTPLYYLTDPWSWYGWRFVAGFLGAIGWMTSEAWLNMVARPESRGRVMAVYTTVIAAGMTIGPFIISAIGIEGFWPFLFIMGATALTALPLLFARGLSPDFSRQMPLQPWRALAHAPTVLIGSVAAGAVDMAIMSLLPVWGVAEGFSQNDAARLISVFAAGSLLMQWPVGWLADHWSQRGTIMICSTVTGAGALLLPLLAGQPVLLWPMIFVWGGVVFGVYTAALALLGDRFPAHELAGANALFIMAYQVGSLGGPPVAGVTMDRFGAMGLPVMIATISAAYLLFSLARRAMMRG